MDNKTVFMRTRFAPSPSGYLHLGHAVSALQVADLAQKLAGQMLLRIEDIDQTRCKPHFTAAIEDDLRWLGLSWPVPVLVQSQRFAAYAAILRDLRRRGLLYPCFCTRRDIARAMRTMTQAPHGDDTTRYAGTCRALAPAQQRARMRRGTGYAWRLHAQRALDGVSRLSWRDLAGDVHAIDATAIDDVVLARKDVGVSYHLAVVADDAHQGITHILRGQDLQPSVALHRLLQEILRFHAPIYGHHPLIYDAQGKRLAKRTPGACLRDLRAAGLSPQQIIAAARAPTGTAFAALRQFGSIGT